MTVGELREALAMFTPDTIVVVAEGEGQEEWTRTRYVGARAVNLGRCIERVAYVAVDLVPAEERDDGDCRRCDELQEAIDEARRALDAA